MSTGRPSVLMLMEDYLGSYTLAIESNPSLRSLAYEDMARFVYAQSIYYGDAYLDAFRKAGVTADQVVPACRPLQYRWAEENGVPIPPSRLSQRPFRWWWTRRGREHPHDRVLREIVAEQVRRVRPDVLWVFSGVPMLAEDVDEWRRYAGTTVLWWSAALTESTPYDRFDLILSCIDPLVEVFRKRGLHAEYMAHAFDSRVLDRVAQRTDRIPRVAFVGNLSPKHAERIRFLDAVAREAPLDFFGSGVEALPADSPLRANARGPIWGDDLYRVYGDYSLVIHKNIDVAGQSASAKRLFEATGMAASVLAEQHESLGRLFVPEEEVATYGSADEATELITALIADARRARAIGLAGQLRTLESHTYTSRVSEFLALIGKRSLPRS